uniref:Uncharacterized protein n=1 Tax=Avena sativa TaxID=4498 RepID=A0ACD5XJ87_AVESA
MAGRTTLVKVVLTSIAIYITVLDVSMEVLMKIDSLRRAFFWVTCDKVVKGKCKVNWETVYKSKKFGGLGILNLNKFAFALRMRWILHEWDEDAKPCVGLGNPCTPHDRELFAASTKVTVGNGKKVLFWDASWLQGMRPKDIAPLIFNISKNKKCSVSKAKDNDNWVAQINTQRGLTTKPHSPILRALGKTPPHSSRSTHYGQDHLEIYQQ